MTTRKSKTPLQLMQQERDAIDITLREREAELATANERADEALARMDECIQENQAAGQREVTWKQTESGYKAREMNLLRELANARGDLASKQTTVDALLVIRDTSTHTIVRHRVAFQRLRRSWLWQWGLLPKEVHDHMREEGI
jgi:DNA-binding response OmpR family regulator